MSPLHTRSLKKAARGKETDSAKKRMLKRLKKTWAQSKTSVSESERGQVKGHPFRCKNEGLRTKKLSGESQLAATG